MSVFNIEVELGTSIRLPTAGKYCDRDIVITGINKKTTYKNAIKTAVDTDGVTIYNGKGYKENTRWSSSSSAEKEYAGVVLTGYIPVKWNDIIRLKNITFSGNGDELDKIHYYEEKGSLKFTRFTSECANAVYDEDGNLIEFTADYTGYIRVQAGGIDDTSVITINEPID